MFPTSNDHACSLQNPASASPFPAANLQPYAPASKLLNMQIPDVYSIRYFVFLEAIGTHYFEL
jgi:hypothetical protein